MSGADWSKTWANWVYCGTARERRLALDMARAEPALVAGNAWLACAAGDDAVIGAALTEDAGWVNRTGGPLGMAPLTAVTHSLLILEDGYEAKLLRAAALLLQHGADASARWHHPDWPDDALSVLYGAAGRTHNAAMTRLLLEAGADPNDGESLYHSIDGRDSTCTRLLLDAGARVTGTNAIGRALDYDRLDDLRLLVDRGGDVNESRFLHHAILRGRSMAHITLLADAGADLRGVNSDGISLFRWAALHGRADILTLLRAAGIDETLTEDEQFVAACAGGDGAAARTVLARVPDIVARLSPLHLQALPKLADLGALPAVELMLDLGWPREVTAAWDATALNLAVYRGDAAMTELLLKSDADWQTRHGYDDIVLGTLSYASQAEPEDPAAPSDFVGCARALVGHGVPVARFTDYVFSPEVTEYLATLGAKAE